MWAGGGPTGALAAQGKSAADMTRGDAVLLRNAEGY